MEKQLKIKMPYTNGLTKDQAEIEYNERKKNPSITNVFLCERKTLCSTEYFVSTIFSKEFVTSFKNILILK